MNRSNAQATTLPLVLLSLLGTSAHADDSEIFYGATASSSNNSANNPNVLLVLDTSGSMTETVNTQNPYDPTMTYSASGCDSSRVYFSSSNTGNFSCSNSNSVPLSTFACADEFATAFSVAGAKADFGIRWRKQSGNNGKYYWTDNLVSSSGNYTSHVTCYTNTGTSQYPFNGSSSNSNDQYSATELNNYWTKGGAKTTYYFYNSNYAAYRAGGYSTSSQSRISLVRNAAKNLINSLSDVNIGIMRYNATGGGGMVLAPVQPVDSAKAALTSTIDTKTQACGYTPLSETLYESYRYFAGQNVLFGSDSYRADGDYGGASCYPNTPQPSVAESRTTGTVDGTQYATPIANTCQKNFVVFLTDGLANGDYRANSDIEAMSTDSGCYSSKSAMWSALGESQPSENGGLCLKELSRAMYEGDLSASLNDKQNVTTYYIGFGDAVAGGGAQAYLQDAAKAGGGVAYTTGSYLGLTSAFESIFSTIKDTSATFTSPSVAVNAFNKTQILEDMYISMFKPSLKAHWPGNVKKFKLRDSTVIDKSYANAVDPATGFFKSSAEDFWQAASDLNKDTTTKGGAANKIPDHGSRSLYTYMGATTHPSAAVALSTYPIDTSSTAVTDAVLGTTTSGSGCGSASDPCRDTLINWARGQDVLDDDGDQSTTDARHVMGDPIHSQPAVVIYGNGSGSSSSTSSTLNSATLDQLNDAVVYVATNDGYLHAFDVVSGVELWAFMPQNLLSDLKTLYIDDTSATKHYSLDGDIRVLKYDVDGDGVVEKTDGDRVILYFGQGRGGSHYYALDVTLKNTPKFLWSLDGDADLSGIVQRAWSTPKLGRVNINGASQNPQKLVLVFGGGYDEAEDTLSYRTTSSHGNGVFMVDAIKGTVLWQQTYSTDANSAFNKMTHAIPSDIATLDTNSDGFTDRMYVGDMAGQLWRFDIINGQPSNTLVRGGVIASLGGKEDPTSDANNRTLYNEPDVSYMTVLNGSNYYNIAIGSGDRGLPKSNTVTQDRFYGIRDYYLRAHTQTEYDEMVPIEDADLTTVNGTTAYTSTTGPGWKLLMSTAEKVLSQSITLNGVTSFTTYIPGATASSCTVGSGKARSYTISVSGKKYFSSLYETFDTTGLPSKITILDEDKIVRTDGTSSSSSSSSNSSESNQGTCLSGVTILSQCVDFGAKVKTFWRDAGAD